MKTKQEVVRSLWALYRQEGVSGFIDSMAETLLLHYEQHRNNREIFKDYALSSRRAKALPEGTDDPRD